MHILTAKIEENRRYAVEAVSVILNSEQSFVNTDHPAFVEYHRYLQGGAPVASSNAAENGGGVFDGSVKK